MGPILHKLLTEGVVFNQEKGLENLYGTPSTLILRTLRMLYYIMGLIGRDSCKGDMTINQMQLFYGNKSVVLSKLWIVAVQRLKMRKATKNTDISKDGIAYSRE